MLQDAEAGLENQFSCLEVVEVRLAWWIWGLVRRERRREQLRYCLRMC